MIRPPAFAVGAPAVALALLLAAPVAAQTKPSLDTRVDRVERELRAVQRKVFPGGAPAFSEPEIAPPPAEAAPAGVPASSPLNDLTARVDAIERSVQQLTNRVEEAEHRLSLLSEQAAKDRAEFDTRLKTLEAAGLPAAGAAGAVAGTGGAAAVPPPAPAGPDDAAPAPARGTAAIPAPGRGRGPRPFPPARFRDDAAGGAPAPAPVPAPAASADETPPAAATGDPAEDAYMAGYQLWKQKKFPQAETALKAVVAKYPKSRRASYAQNLLGRAYLDDGQPARAAEAFAANYQTNPRGERAQESLYYLGQSLIQLKKPADACRVYDELDAAYGDKVTDAMKTRVAAARRDAKCK